MSEPIRFHRGATLLRPQTSEDFEQLTCALLAALYDDRHADRVGRNGQAQGGVDVMCKDKAGRLIGAQCKLSQANPYKPPPKSQLTEAVGQARKAYPTLAEFLFLTTAPNDVELYNEAQRLDAENRSESLFSVHYHGWGWIQEMLHRHADVAIRFNLVAVVEPTAPAAAPSRLMLEIAERLRTGLELINAGQDRDAALTLPQLAKRPGMPDWLELEAIFDGASTAPLTRLEGLACDLGLRPEWVIEGKLEPFAQPEGPYDADHQFDEIVRLKPQRIVFVREDEPHFSALVAAQLDDLRWRVFDFHPTGPDVGATGRSQIFEFCILIRRLYSHYGLTISIAGTHVTRAQFQDLLCGRIYPGSLLALHWNDPWWTDFAELSDARAAGPKAADVSLVATIKIAQKVLAEHRARANDKWYASQLAKGSFPRDPDADLILSGPLA